MGGGPGCLSRCDVEGCEAWANNLTCRRLSRDVLVSAAAQVGAWRTVRRPVRLGLMRGALIGVPTRVPSYTIAVPITIFLPVPS
jgi:hypothetical protein